MTERRLPWRPLLIAAVALLTYANALANGFALDDNWIIAGNARVHQLGDPSQIWLTPYWPTFGTTLGLYRPLTIFGYALQWAIGGGAPWLFHLVNILLHAGASALVYALSTRLTSRTGALAGGLLFAVHPLHTEVVANVVGQAELLAACAVLAACAIWAGRPEGVRISRGRTLAVLALFGLGLLAKEGAIVLPPLLVALDLAQRRLTLERGRPTDWLHAVIVPFLLVAAVLAAYLTLRVHVLGSVGGMDAAPNLPFLRQEGRVFSALRAWPEYVRLLFFPFDLSADYSPAVLLPATEFTPMVALGAFMLAGVAALALATPVRPEAGLPAAWFLIAVFPVSNLVLPIGVLMAERILYLPSVAIGILAAHLVTAARTAIPQERTRLAAAAGIVVLAAFAGRSYLRNPDWKSTDAVWDALVRDHPESYRAQWINGARAHDRGDLVLARDYWELAVRIWPDDPELLNGLASLHVQLGNPERAMELLARARSIAPYAGRIEILLAYALLELGRHQEALDAINRADRLNANRATAFALRAGAYQGLGRWQEAAGAWRAAVQLPDGNTWTFYAMLARALARSGQPSEALAAADSALARLPADPNARRDVEALTAAIRNGCYVDPDRHSEAPGATPASCADPLAEWAIVVPAAPQEVATPSQNAMSRGREGR